MVPSAAPPRFVSRRGTAYANGSFMGTPSLVPRGIAGVRLADDVVDKGHDGSAHGTYGASQGLIVEIFEYPYPSQYGLDGSVPECLTY